MDSFSDLQALVKHFNRQRNWTCYTPSSLAQAISIEAAELLECFLWKSDEEQLALIQGDSRTAISEELADVFIYCLTMAQEFDIDLPEAVRNKLKKNHDRFPVKACISAG